jgi:hypothetical protein
VIGVPGRLLLLCVFCAVSTTSAQDLFEVHVYQYEPLKWGQYSFETHLNYAARGAGQSGETHLSLEPTIGVAPIAAVGFMLLNAWQAGNSPEVAGWRVLPHLYAPQSWHLPIHLGFVSEFSFEKPRYEQNTRRVELRLILDREFRRWEIAVNPVLERALHGPGTRYGWNFAPAALIRWKREPFSPSVEYYGQVESINVPPRAQPEVHQLFLGGDWVAKPGFSVNFGTGFDLGSRGPGIVVKSRLEWTWQAHR